MEFESLEAIIDFAIEKEIEAADFYQGLSHEASMSGAKQMLEEFAREERKHQTLLEKIKSKGFDESVVEYKFKWIPDLKRGDYLVELEYSDGMGYNELLILAMKREEKALALYNILLKRAEGIESQKFFKILCQEEANHKLKLETLYDDYMAEMGD